MSQPRRKRSKKGAVVKQEEAPTPLADAAPTLVMPPPEALQDEQQQQQESGSGFKSVLGTKRRRPAGEANLIQHAAPTPPPPPPALPGTAVAVEENQVASAVAGDGAPGSAPGMQMIEAILDNGTPAAASSSASATPGGEGGEGADKAGTESPDAKRQKKLERQRLAARASRARKKRYIQSLEMSVRRLYQENDALKREIARLQSIVYQQAAERAGFVQWATLNPTAAASLPGGASPDGTDPNAGLFVPGAAGAAASPQPGLVELPQSLGGPQSTSPSVSTSEDAAPSPDPGAQDPCQQPGQDCMSMDALFAYQNMQGLPPAVNPQAAAAAAAMAQQHHMVAMQQQQMGLLAPPMAQPEPMVEADGQPKQDGVKYETDALLAPPLTMDPNAL